MNFKIGDRVIMTELAVSNLGEGKRRGVIDGHCRNSEEVKVLVDGTKNSCNYAMEFWEFDPITQNPGNIDIGDYVTIPGKDWTGSGRIFVVSGRVSGNGFAITPIFGDGAGNPIQSYTETELLKLHELCKK